MQPEPAVQAQDRLRHRRADDDRDRGGHHEERAGACALLGRNPVRQIEHDAREEPGLRDPEHDARRVERHHVGHEHRQHRDDAPDDHDPRDPQSRADAVEDDVAWNLEEAVAEEEQPGADAVLRVAQPEVTFEGPRGEPDVHPIDVRDYVADEDERDDASRDAVDDEPATGGGRIRHGSRGADDTTLASTQSGRDLDLDAHSRVRQAGADHRRCRPHLAEPLAQRRPTL